MTPNEAYAAAYQYIIRLERAREDEYVERCRGIKKEVYARHASALAAAKEALLEANEARAAWRVEKAQAEFSTLPRGIIEEWKDGSPTGRRGIYIVVTPDTRIGFSEKAAGQTWRRRRPGIGWIVIQLFKKNGKPSFNCAVRTWTSEGLRFGDWRPAREEEEDG